MAQFGFGLVIVDMSSRIRSRCWFFTWNNPGKDVLAQIGNTFHSVEYVCQLELGDSGTPHLQGVVRYKNPRDCVEDCLFSLCHWERCRNWKAACKYCSKVATRIDGPWTNIDGLLFRKTIIDPLAGRSLYPWQEQAIDLIRGDIHPRFVYWFADANGAAGKTSLCKHIVLRWGNRCRYFNGCSRDILFALASHIDKYDCDIALFNLSRQDMNKVSYKSLEILKDGIGFSGKYESCQLVFNPMHVLVFANFFPEYEMLSADRWKVISVSPS